MLKKILNCVTVCALMLSLLVVGGLLRPDGSGAAALQSCVGGVSGCHFKTAILDGTARNVPAGMFPGTHARHSGFSTSSVKKQYQYTCTQCHPSSGYANNHQSGFKNITGIMVPGTSYSQGKRIANTNTPTFGNCGNIYCHSSGRATGMGQRQYSSAKWGGTVTCLSCHGGRITATGVTARSRGGFSLSTTHYQHLKYSAGVMNCQICHSKTATDGATLKSYTGVTRHVNSKRDVTFAASLSYGSYTAFKSTDAGSSANTKTCNNLSCHGGKTRSAWSAATTNNSNTCVHCHGVAGTVTLRADKYDSAPGWGGTGTSTDQVTASSDLRVGAHFVHLSSVYMPKLKCTECHMVPSSPFDGTHMATARYNSQTLNFTQASTAKRNGAVPTFTMGTAATAALCSNLYCHGNSLPNSDSSGGARNPLWNQNTLMSGAAGADCATCHGNPPTLGAAASVHRGAAATTSCYACHKSVTNAGGAIINKALHLNGTVTALVDTSVTTTCHSCHGNPPQGVGAATFGGYSGLAFPKTNALGTAPTNGNGAHLKHKAKGMLCAACHFNYSAGSHPDKQIQVGFQVDGTNWPGIWNAGSPNLTFGGYSGNAPTGGSAAISTNTSLIRTTVMDTANARNSCNLYCHGSWSGSNKNKNPSWTDGTAATTCGSCHGYTATTPPLIGTHARHAGYSSFQTKRQGYSFTCVKCHPGRIVGDDHIKGTVHVRFSTAIIGTSARYTKTGGTWNNGAVVNYGLSNKMAGDTPDGTCSNIYCHSTGRATGMGILRNVSTAQWGNNTRLSCLACHGGRASATGAPARSLVKSFTLSTTHSQHLKYPAANMNCQICHSKTVTDAATLKNFSGVKRHVNRVRDVTFTDIAYGTYTSYKSTEAGSAGNIKTCNNISCHGGKTRSAWNATTTNNNASCVHCHGVDGSATMRADLYNAAPGWAGTGTSTDQINANTDIRVGAHFVHLSSVYMKKLKCNECHTVPATPFSGTHMAALRYNSQTLTFAQASTATRNTTTPAMVNGTAVTAATCSTTFCHGSKMPKGDSSGTARSPLWNQAALMTGVPGADCGTCHGNPPTLGTTAATHSGKTATTSCVQCHGMVLNSTGTIIDKSLHMNGTVNALADCNGCHAYDVTGAGTLWTTAAGTQKSHNAHVAFIKTRLGFASLSTTGVSFGAGRSAAVCGTCHTNFTSQHNNQVKDILWGSTDGTAGTSTYTMGSGTASSMGLLFGGNPAWTGTTGTNITCSNLACHYYTTPNWY